MCVGRLPAPEGAGQGSPPPLHTILRGGNKQMTEEYLGAFCYIPCEGCEFNNMRCDLLCEGCDDYGPIEETFEPTPDPRNDIDLPF